MPIHLAGFFQNVHNATPAPIAAMADTNLRVVGNDIVVPDQVSFVAGAFYLSANALRAQLNSPSQRRIFNNEVYAVNRNAALQSNPNFSNFFDSPIALDAQENLEFWTADDVGTTVDQYGLIWLSSGRIQPVTGNIRTVRVTSATTLVAKTWSNAPLTFDQSLPAGRYQVVGARFASAGIIAFRFRFLGGDWLPGALGQIAASDVGRAEFRRGGMGVWGEFSHNTPPTVDFLATSADTSEVGVLDLIKIA